MMSEFGLSSKIEYTTDTIPSFISAGLSLFVPQCITTAFKHEGTPPFCFLYKTCWVLSPPMPSLRLSVV